MPKLYLLSGNIRVYCRVRPFFGQLNSAGSVGSIEEGSISMITPSKYGKEGKKTFNFNRVFGPSATQGWCLPTFSLELFATHYYVFLITLLFHMQRRFLLTCNLLSVLFWMATMSAYLLMARRVQEKRILW